MRNNNQTPKEKANDLVKQMYAVRSNSASDITLCFAKNCAIIAVNEIMESIKILPMGIQYLSERDYWEEVKTHIALS